MLGHTLPNTNGTTGDKYKIRHTKPYGSFLDGSSGAGAGGAG